MMSKLSLSVEQIRLLRLRAQHLLSSRDEQEKPPAELVREAAGIQAQDLPAAYLSIRVRGRGLTSENIDRARQEERTILWTWSMRGTLHLIPTGEARWLIPFLGPKFSSGDNARLRQVGWIGGLLETGLRLLREALEKNGSLTREEIKKMLEQNHLPYQGQAAPHLIFQAALKSWLCQGKDQGNKPSYVLTESWIGRLENLSKPEALARLAEWYLNAYAPAQPEDLAKWSGISLTEAREGWKGIESKLLEVETPGGNQWMLAEQSGWLDSETFQETNVLLLPRYDTFFMGYRNRRFTIDPAHERRIFPGGGLIHPAVLVDGRVIGSWKLHTAGKKLEIQVQPFEPLDREWLPLIEHEAQDIARFRKLPLADLKFVD